MPRLSARPALAGDGARADGGLGDQPRDRDDVHRTRREQPVPAQDVGSGAPRVQLGLADAGSPDRVRLPRRGDGGREQRRGRAAGHARLRQVASHRVHVAPAGRCARAAAAGGAVVRGRRGPRADAADRGQRRRLCRGAPRRRTRGGLRLRTGRSHPRAGRAGDGRDDRVRRRPPRLSGSRSRSRSGSFRSTRRGRMLR